MSNDTYFEIVRSTGSEALPNWTIASDSTEANRSSDLCRVSGKCASEACGRPKPNARVLIDNSKTKHVDGLVYATIYTALLAAMYLCLAPIV